MSRGFRKLAFQSSNAEADANQHARSKAVSKSTRPAPVSPDGIFFSLYASQRSVYAQSTHSLRNEVLIENQTISYNLAFGAVSAFFLIEKKESTSGSAGWADSLAISI